MGPRGITRTVYTDDYLNRQIEFNQKSTEALQTLVKERQEAATPDDYRRATDKYKDAIYELRDRLAIKESAFIAG
jgi:hypothetical protein